MHLSLSLRRFRFVSLFFDIWKYSIFRLLAFFLFFHAPSWKVIGWTWLCLGLAAWPGVNDVVVNGPSLALIEAGLYIVNGLRFFLVTVNEYSCVSGIQ